MADIAEVVWTAGGQIVRLPEAYSFQGSEVRIGREGGRIYLETIGGAVTDEQTRARKLTELRALIQEGLDSGDDEPWDAEEIKRFARDGR